MEKRCFCCCHRRTRDLGINHQTTLNVNSSPTYTDITHRWSVRCVAEEHNINGIADYAIMTASFPYTYISCPCSSQALDTEAFLTDRRASYFPQVKEDDEEEEDKPLNPHDPRSSYSLYPYDHLLYCDECQQIRCPKCWTEEITNWYCPSCLFEVPSSLIKTDGNR